MNMQDIIIIAAMAENRVIGRNNEMPWSIKGNLAHFKKMTMGWPCIMGRKTWESLPVKPLPGRLNIIISNTMTEESQNSSSHISSVSSVPPCFCVKIFDTISSAIEFCADYEKIFICGGESIYKQVMPLATKIDLSLIPGHYDGDTFFPEIDDTSWEKTAIIYHDNFSVNTYNRINIEKRHK